MPPTNVDEGLVAAETIRRRWPDVGVLVLSQYVESEYALRLLDGGEERCGYLLKDRVLDVDDFLDSIRRVAAGGSALDPEVVGRLLTPHRTHDPLHTLTHPEREVLGLLVEGLPNKLIARRLEITEKTVKSHLTRIFRELDVTDRTQAALWAERQGLGRKSH